MLTRRSVLFSLPVIVIILFLGGCAIHRKLPETELKSPAPAIPKKMPLKVAIVVPDEKLVMEKEWGHPDLFFYKTNFAVPFGHLVKTSAMNVFSNVFELVEIVTSEPYPEDVDALILLNIKDCHYNFLTMRSYLLERRFDAIVYMKLVVTDNMGITLYEKDISSDRIETLYTLFSGKRYALYAESFGQAIQTALVTAAQEMAATKEVKEYVHAKASGPKQFTRIAAKKCDIDEPPAIKTALKKKAYAVVIGIEQYRQNLPRADYATHDAEMVARYLSKVMGFPEENIVTLLNQYASKSDLEKYFERWIQNNVDKDSVLFVYFSGHGAPDSKTGDAFLVPYDGDPSFIENTGYSLKRLYDVLGKLPAKNITVALDSCFSGAGKRSVIAKGTRPLVITSEKITPKKGAVVVMAATSGHQTSSSYDEKGHGMFTYFLLKGLKGEGDMNKDGNIELSELFNYLKPQVENIARKQYNNEQTPQLFVPSELATEKLIMR